MKINKAKTIAAVADDTSGLILVTGNSFAHEKRSVPKWQSEIGRHCDPAMTTLMVSHFILPTNLLVKTVKIEEGRNRKKTFSVFIFHYLSIDNIYISIAILRNHISIYNLIYINNFHIFLKN